MKNSQLFKIVWAAMLIISAIGCTAKVTGGNGDGGPLFPKDQSQKTELEGTWDTGCVAFGSQMSIDATSSFAGHAVVVDLTVYSDSRCTSKTQEQQKSGTFTIGSQDKNVLDAKDIDYIVTDASGNKENDYDIFKIGGDNLYFGNQVGKSASDRPQSLNMMLPYKKIGGPAPTPSPTPQPAPQACKDFTGRYQMNSDYFAITQNGCSKLTWSDLANGGDVTHTFDGVERDVSSGSTKLYETAHISAQDFVLDYLEVATDGSKHTQNERYFFTKTPCNLINPNGSEYFTLEIYRDGGSQSVGCYFWSKAE